MLQKGPFMYVKWLNSILLSNLALFSTCRMLYCLFTFSAALSLWSFHLSWVLSRQQKELILCWRYLACSSPSTLDFVLEVVNFSNEKVLFIPNGITGFKYLVKICRISLGFLLDFASLMALLRWLWGSKTWNWVAEAMMSSPGMLLVHLSVI